MSVVRLRPCQVSDPGRGSFMVNPIMVKDRYGNPKTVTINGVKHQVFRAANHLIHARKGLSVEPHDYAIDYIEVRS